MCFNFECFWGRVCIPFDRYLGGAYTTDAYDMTAPHPKALLCESHDVFYLRSGLVFIAYHRLIVRELGKYIYIYILYTYCI